MLESLVPGEVHRAQEVRSELAGKGVNVTHNLRIAGIPSVAVLPMKQEEASLLGHDQIHVYPVEAATRINVTLLDRAGQTTKIN
ncbi:MAG: 1-phosphofructokinase, partial [Pontimonas sp.]